MRTRLTVGLALLVMTFLLATHPVVAEAARQITGKQIKNGTVTGKDVRNGSLLGADFAAGQLPAGPAGPAGPTGARGPAGPAGPVGPVAAISGPRTGISFNTGAEYEFVGPTMVVAVAQGDAATTALSIGVRTNSGTATVVFDACYQPVAGGSLTSLTTGGFMFTTVTTDRQVVALAGVSTPLPAGSIRVGACALMATAAVQAVPQDWVSGWVQVVPGSSVVRARPAAHPAPAAGAD